MQISKGKFEIPSPRQENGTYAKAFREFANGNEPMMKVTFDTDKEVKNCYCTYKLMVKRHDELGKFKVLRRKHDIYVVREG